MIVALTGHRSEDCISEKHVRDGVRSVLETVSEDGAEPIDAVICGMANGFDLWAGTEFLRLGVPAWAARPWATHGPRTSDVELYAEVLASAERVVVVTETDEYPGPWVYHKRNEWMVDNADRVLAYWSGKERGGTYACINYANKVDKKVRNIYG